MSAVLRFVLLVLAGVQLHAVQWANCPVCGRGHSTLTPGQPCSSVCAAKQAQDRALRGGSPTAEPDYGRGGGRHGKDVIGGGGGGRHGDGSSSACGSDLVLVPALLVALATQLARRGRR